MSNTVLLLSGIRIPVIEGLIPASSVINDNNPNLKETHIFNNAPKLKQLITSGEVFIWEGMDELYLKYINEPTFDNFIPIVDRLTFLFSKITLNDFVTLQSDNRHLSNLGYKFLVDFIDYGDYYRDKSTFNAYTSIHSILELTKEPSLEDLDKRKRITKELNKHNSMRQTKHWLNNIYEDREYLNNFVRLVLVSPLGGSYA